MRRIFILVTTLLALAVAAYGFVEARHEEKVAAPTVRVNPVVPAPVLVETLGADLPLATYDTEQFIQQRFVTLLDEGSYVGSAGHSPSDGRFAIWWKGQFPPELREKAAALGTLPIDVYSTRFSEADIKDQYVGQLQRYSEVGICASTWRPGAMAIELQTEQDPPSLIEVPQFTEEGIPLLIVQRPCPRDK